MNTLFVIDIDGTICDARKRYEKAGPEPTGPKTSAEYTRWVTTIMDHSMMLVDPAVPGMQDMLRAIYQADSKLIFVTSREEAHRDITERWLRINGFGWVYDALVMRPIGNLDPDHELKERQIQRYTTQNGHYNSVLVLDDDLRGELAKVCATNGWTFLKAVGNSL